MKDIRREHTGDGSSAPLPSSPSVMMQGLVTQLLMRRISQGKQETHPAPLNGKSIPELPGPPPSVKTTGAFSGSLRAGKYLRTV
jgi:hypothetical protein